MASRWLDSDVFVLGRLAVLWDAFYTHPEAHAMAEIRLQEQRFGLSPIDRVRLSWEVARADGAERNQHRPASTRTHADPRTLFMAVEGGKP
jgi:hypothetical protein